MEGDEGGKDGWIRAECDLEMGEAGNRALIGKGGEEGLEGGDA